MTTAEMVQEFYILLDSTSNAFSEDEYINSTEVLNYLNWSQNDLFKKKYLSAGSVEDNIKNIQNYNNELLKLYSEYEFDNVTVTSTNPYLYKVEPETDFVDTNFVHYISSETKLTRTKHPAISTEKYIPNVYINIDKMKKFYTNEFNIPIIYKPLVNIFQADEPQAGPVISEYTFRILVDKYTTPTKFRLDYLRMPKKMVLALPADPDAYETLICELNVDMHQEIVEYSVRKYLEEYKLKLAKTK
jgi:hypothetical protein